MARASREQSAVKKKTAAVKKKAAAPAKKASATTTAAKKTTTTTKKKSAVVTKTAAAPAKKKATAAKKAAAPAKKKATAVKKAAAAPAKKKATTTKKTTTTTKTAQQPPVIAAGLPERVAANEDLPRAPTGYRVDFVGRRCWPSVVVGEHAFAGDDGRSPLAEAGKPLFVAYQRRAEDLDAHGVIERVELYYRFGHGPAHMLSATSTTPACIDVPARARGVLELWFKLVTDDGRVLWDSDFGRNHRVDIVPAGEVFVLFEGERTA